MSYAVFKAVRERNVGSPLRQIILLELADYASDDGTEIYPTKPTIAAPIQCTVRVVQKIMNEFLAEGLIVETGKRKCHGGYVREYAIDLEALERLPLRITPESPAAVKGEWA